MNFFKPLLAATLAACAPMAVHSVGIDFPTDISQNDKPATIKVLIGKQKEKIYLEAKGPHNIYNPLNGILLAEESSKTKEWVTTNNNGLQWNGVLPGVFQFRVVPTNSQTTLHVDGNEYKGCLEVYEMKGKLYVINEIDIERYLKSTLASLPVTEMDEEVMDAIAIAARTNAYYLATRKSEAFWNVDAQEVGYQGQGVTLQNLDIERAINSTRHMVMLYKGAPFPASWTKDCAGKTADYQSIFRKAARAPHGVDSPFAAHDREKHAWKFAISKKELAKALGAKFVTSLDLYKDEKTEKVYAARLKDSTNEVQFDFTKLQTALGAARLKSNDFTVEISGDQVVFQGYGEGSGVGLCLYSASALADKGSKAPKILATFFPETQLQNVRSLGDRPTEVK